MIVADVTVDELIQNHLNMGAPTKTKDGSQESEYSVDELIKLHNLKNQIAAETRRNTTGIYVDLI